ncbi:MAG: right-handed parallel beta-helix repeat-containing protein, partial [FCB group bacterium]|nr:right-handed parallel beta-helix repeat-containing protein [FCB group bacterium]
MLHINFSRNVMGLLVLLLLSGLLMAQNEPEFGQVWQKSSLNPVFENIPVPGTWNSGGQSNHSTGKAMWDGENYRVYLACKGPDPDANLSIGVFLSPHLDSGWVAYENNPVFESDSTNWDVLDIGAPYVMKDGDIYKMWYSALNAADVRHIGYAESADGYSWDRHLTPVLSPDLDSDWESDNVMSPFVMKENDSTYFMWYDAKSSGLPWQIGVAQSSDGIQWTRPTPDPVITNAPWTAFWLRFPTVIHTGEKYVMWFGGGPTNVFTTPGRMGTAVSDDGINWRQDDLYNPIMSGETAAWDDLVVLTAGIFYEDDHYRMLYLGTDAEWDHVSIAVADYLPTIVATGDVSGTWTKAGSPYRVEGEISVPDGETLTIEAGTTVEFLNPSPLNVLGRILALGTDDERIRFRVDDTLGIYDDAAMEGVWGGIKFANTPTTNDSSRLSYCDIEFGDSWAGGSNNGGGIKIYNFGKLTVDNCLIQYNRAVRGVAGNYAYGGGICINYNSHPKILNNVIQHNHTNHLLEISGDTGGGIMVYDGSNPLISGNIIRWNRATETGGGLGIWTDSEPMIINNLIVENTALREDGTGGAGGGVATGWGSRPVLLNNTIAENVAGWTGGGFFSHDGDALF